MVMIKKKIFCRIHNYLGLKIEIITMNGHLNLRPLEYPALLLKKKKKPHPHTRLTQDTPSMQRVKSKVIA